MQRFQNPCQSGAAENRDRNNEHDRGARNAGPASIMLHPFGFNVGFFVLSFPNWLTEHGAISE
jgi:hypothetical protein